MVTKLNSSTVSFKIYHGWIVVSTKSICVKLNILTQRTIAACARDIKIFESQGISHKLTCDNRGSYESVQHLGARSYCVDAMGYSVTDYMDDSLPECKKYLYDHVDTETYCNP